MIPEEEVPEGCNAWSNALLGKFLGRRLDPKFVARHLTRRWRMQWGEFEGFPLSNGYYTLGLRMRGFCSRLGFAGDGLSQARS